MGLIKSGLSETKLIELIGLHAPTIEGLTQAKVLELIEENDDTGFTEEEIKNFAKSVDLKYQQGQYTGTGTASKTIYTNEQPQVVIIGSESFGMTPVVLFKGQKQYKVHDSTDTFTVSWATNGVIIDWGIVTKYNASGYSYKYGVFYQKQ